jgi:hypothetical protein
MPFFKRLKNSVLSLNKSSSAAASKSPNGLLHANGNGVITHGGGGTLNRTNMSSTNTFDSFHNHSVNNNTTLNTTRSSSNANNTTLSSINSNSMFSSSRMDPTYRNLIVYHIDSETEGDFTISVKVTLFFLLRGIITYA